MTTLAEARDAICSLVNTGWLASGVTSGLTLLWDDVAGDRPGFDVNQKPIAYGRCTVRHLSSSTESLGLGDGFGKEEHLGQVVVQCFGPKGRGRATVDAVAQVVKGFFQRQRIGAGVDGWFTSVTAVEVPDSGSHAQTNVVAQFRYTERVA